MNESKEKSFEDEKKERKKSPTQEYDKTKGNKKRNNGQYRSSRRHNLKYDFDWS